MIGHSFVRLCLLTLFLTACVFMVGAAARGATTGETGLIDAAYKDACGPFSCLVALRLLGVDSSLETVAKKCNWSEGEPVDLASMQRTLDGYSGVDCKAVNLTPSKLIDLLSSDQAVVILAIRKNSEEINHSVCVGWSDRASQSIQWIDYPEFAQVRHISELSEIWDGTALVVEWSPAFSMARRFATLILPALVLGYLIQTLRRG